MTEFLSWLYGVASFVYQWFGSNFGSYVHIVANVWNWIVDTANDTYQAAINKAREYVQDAYDDINGLFDWVTYQFENFTNGVLEDLSNLYDWVVYQIENIPIIELPNIQGMIDSVYEYINSIPEQLYNWFWDRVSEIYNWVWDNFGWVNGAIDYLQGLINSLPFDLFTVVREFIDNTYPIVKEFFDNPVETIFDLVQEKIVSSLCYILAYALGTTTKELPIQPPWKE
jgi:hypothetical protein